MSCPERGEAPSRPNISGSSSRPELVALAPVTSCRYRGKKLITPNMANPMMKLTALDTSKVELRNRVSGMMGSAARRSTSAKAVSRTGAASPRPTIVEDPQAYSAPPQVVRSTTQATPAASRAAPRVVDAVAHPGLAGVQGERGDDQGGQAE